MRFNNQPSSKNVLALLLRLKPELIVGGEQEIHHVTYGGQVWERQLVESERELKDRAIREVPPPKAGCRTVFLC